MKIKVKKSELHGIGVFATKNIMEGEIIEECPILLIPIKEEKLLDQTHLYNYYYEWDKNYNVILLGFGSIYNHSYNANSEFNEDYKNETMILTAIKDIKEGEEITVNYNGDFNNKEKVWFEKK